MAKEPAIVKFAYENFENDAVNKKWRASCKVCKTTVTEVVGTTSSFSRYVNVMYFLFGVAIASPS